MNARTGGDLRLPLPTGWDPVEAPPTVEDTSAPRLVSLPVTGAGGEPAWLFTVAGEIGTAARRRLRSEQPELDATLRAAAADPAGAALLPWIEYGDPKGPRPYLVSARPGPTFADDLRRGALPAAVVLATALTCVDALRVLHRYGRAHGQIAPESLHHDGPRVRLAAPLPPALAELVAASGGTGHEAPEVLRGGDHDAAADVFALASTVWTLLAGRPPFGVQDHLTRLTAAGPPPLHRADVPAAVESALRAALAPDPARRPDLPALQQALRIVAPSEPSARPLSPVSEAGERLDTLAPTRPVDDTGQPLGSRYLLDALIGRGATGHVWRGHVRDVGTPVAVKLLRAEYSEDADVVTRFMRERTTLTRLQHPNLVAVRDLVAEGEALAIVMDLVDGPDLRSVLARGPMPLPEAAVLLSQTASALAAVHAAGIVHRDLKPENVLVEPRPEGARARLTDFGLARAVESPSATRATQLVGTPAYVAPEVVAGRAPGPPVDVYALGITAYELIAGRRPFAADSTAALLRAHLDEPAPRPDAIPDPAWEVVEACLAKDPLARPTADALAAAWSRIADGEPPGPLTAPAAAPPRFAPPPPFAPPAPAPGTGPLPSSTAVQPTTGAQRPLVARHASPPPGRPGIRRFWWIAAAAVVLAFGGGFAGYALVHHSDGAKPSNQPTDKGYPLDVQLAPQGDSVIVSWRVPPSVVTAKTVVIVQPEGRPAVGPLSATSTNFALGDMKPGQCVSVFAYYTAKPPASAAAKPKCLPNTTSTRSSSG